jgi:hypothetical protein
MGEETSLSSRMVLAEAKSRMMRVLERVAMRGKVVEEDEKGEEEDDDAAEEDLLTRKGDAWREGEKALREPMILE